MYLYFLTPADFSSLVSRPHVARQSIGSRRAAAAAVRQLHVFFQLSSAAAAMTTAVHLDNVGGCAVRAGVGTKSQRGEAEGFVLLVCNRVGIVLRWVNVSCRVRIKTLLRFRVMQELDIREREVWCWGAGSIDPGHCRRHEIIIEEGGKVGEGRTALPGFSAARGAGQWGKNHRGQLGMLLLAG